MAKKRQTGVKINEAEVEKLISTVMQHYQARMFLADLPLSVQIEHLELEIFLRDTMLQAKYFQQKVEDLKNELKVKEMYLLAKKRGLFEMRPKSVDAFRQARWKKTETAMLPQDDETFFSERGEELPATNDIAGPPDLRARHIYCRSRFVSTKTDHANALAPYEDILEVALPLRHCYKVIEAREMLRAEFPHALNVIDELLRPILSQTQIGTVVQPTLIWGKPGLGKSRLARRVCEVLGLHAEVVSVAGMAEDFIFGVPLGFASAKASIVTEGIKRSGCANPVIIIDEVDKISDNRRFGSVHDRLLSHLERSEAMNQYDAFLNTHVDSSRVGWILTANDLAAVPSVLKSRLRIVEIAVPSSIHVPALLENIRIDLAAREGLSDLWFPKFLPYEVELLSKYFDKHRSVRVLQRQATHVLLSRTTTKH